MQAINGLLLLQLPAAAKQGAAWNLAHKKAGARPAFSCQLDFD
jgi:hypothetical protein